MIDIINYNDVNINVIIITITNHWEMNYKKTWLNYGKPKLFQI